MNINKTRKIVFWVYFLSVICFILLLAVSFLNLKRTNSESDKIKKAMTDLTILQRISIDIKSIESGQRGFLISGNEEFLAPYHEGMKNIGIDTIKLKSSVSDTGLNDKRNELLSLINSKIIHTKNIISLRKRLGHDTADAVVSQKEGLILMNHINNLIQYFTDRQISIISSYTKENENLINKRYKTYLLLLLLLVMISGVTYYLFNKVFEEQTIRDKEIKYNAALLSNLYDPVIATDINYLITSWNKNAEELFGYMEEEVLGKRLKDVLQSRSEQHSIEELKNIIAKKTRWNGDIIYKSKTGDEIFANVSTSLVFDENNNNTGTVSIIRNLTDKKIAENKLQELTANQENEIESKVAELKTVFERTTDAFVSFDNDLNYIYVNDKAASLHSSTVSEMTGKNILYYTPQKSSPEFYEALLIVLKERKEIHNELRYGLTGQWFENWIYPDENGISVFYRDITARKNNEEAIISTNKQLEELNNRFELILKGTNDAIWDWDMKTNEIWGNEKYYELLKNKPDEKSNFEYFVDRMHPDDATSGFDLLNKHIADKKTSMTSEYRYLNDRDNWITLLNRQTIIYDKDGNAIRILGTLQDITEQKKIQEQIIHEKELSDVLINSLPGVFYMFNIEGKYLRWNRNLLEITGVSEEQMTSTANPVNFVPEEQRELFAQKIANVFKTGIDNVEGDLIGKDNTRIPYYFTGVYIKYNGEDCMMGVGIDISDKVKTQKELRDLATHLQNIREEERSRIAREIHDELGQQLTGLKMQVSWLNKKIKPESEEVKVKMNDSLFLIDETVKTVRRIATQLRPSMLDDLGLLSAMEWQSDEFQKRFHIDSTIDNMAGNLELTPEKSTAIFRIFQESLTNVLRHSKATSVVTSLSIEDNKLVMKITDNGIGINEKEVYLKKSLGILGMKERTIMLGGSYQISSKEDEGVTVLVKLPLDD